MNFFAGNKGEQKVTEYYDALGFETNKNEGKTLAEMRGFDLITKGHNLEFKTEVKYDIKSQWTGNIAIELYNTKSGHDSGINATEADLWAHIANKIYLCPVVKLKEYVENEKCWKTIHGAGDDNALINLYKMDILMPAIFICMDDLCGEEALEAIKEMLK